MSHRDRPSRLGHATSTEESRSRGPTIHNTPPLPVVNFGAVGKTAPGLPANPETLPRANVVVLCWEEAEWAPLQHVFVSGNQAMPYGESGSSTWPGWQKFADGSPASVGFWGYYRLVTVGLLSVLLFKSNVHLDQGPKAGTSYLEQMISLLIDRVAPTLVLSTGTAGGTRNTDPIGTVNIVSAGTLYGPGAPTTWPTYTSAWKPSWTIPGDPRFQSMLLPIPTTSADLSSLVSQFNANEGTSYTILQLNPGNLNMGAPVPAINNLTPEVSLLTTTTFVVGETNGNFAAYSCIEMDDAVIGKVCNASNVSFGFVRNLSDPAQNGALPSKIQGAWGSFVYEAYRFYTSYAGALAVWAVLA
jgi:hypothetical protein